VGHLRSKLRFFLSCAVFIAFDRQKKCYSGFQKTFQRFRNIIFEFNTELRAAISDVIGLCEVNKITSKILKVPLTFLHSFHIEAEDISAL
jgi:hypothetical protein